MVAYMLSCYDCRVYAHIHTGTVATSAATTLCTPRRTRLSTSLRARASSTTRRQSSSVTSCSTQTTSSGKTSPPTMQTQRRCQHVCVQNYHSSCNA